MKTQGSMGGKTYGLRLFMAARFANSLGGTPFGMEARIMLYCAGFMAAALGMLMRLLRCSFCIWAMV